MASPAGLAGPAVVFANAATPRGIGEPAVAALLSGLAGAGFVAVAAELPHVREGEVTPQTVEALVAVAVRPALALRCSDARRAPGWRSSPPAIRAWRDE